MGYKIAIQAELEDLLVWEKLFSIPSLDIMEQSIMLVCLKAGQWLIGKNIFSFKLELLLANCKKRRDGN